MLLECARGVATRAKTYDMCRIRKNQPGRLNDRRDDAISIELAYNGRGRGRASALTRARSEIEGHGRM